MVRSDWLFRMPSLHLAEAQLEAGGRAYLYELTWPAPGMGGVLGACHGLDVPLVFGNLTAGQPAMLIGEPTPEAEAMSAQMRTRVDGVRDERRPRLARLRHRRDAAVRRRAEVTAYPEQVSRQIWRVGAGRARPVGGLTTKADPGVRCGSTASGRAPHPQWVMSRVAPRGTVLKDATRYPRHTSTVGETRDQRTTAIGGDIARHPELAAGRSARPLRA